MNNKNFFKKYDLILYTFLLILCIAALLVTAKFYKKEGKYLYVYSQGQELAVLDLSQDTEYIVTYQEHFNKVVIKSGYAYISQSDCPDRVCEKSGKIKSVGESVICLPHKLKIQIKSSKVQGYI